MKFAIAAVAALLAAGQALAQTPSAMPGMSAKDHAAMSATSSAKTVQGVGAVKGVNAKAGTITLHHGPIAALKWPAMTMTFKATPEVLKTAKNGQNVKFTLQPDRNEVVAIQAN